MTSCYCICIYFIICLSANEGALQGWDHGSMLVWLVEQVENFIISLMLLIFICKVNLPRKFQNLAQTKALIWKVSAIFCGTCRSAKAGYYASRYKRFGNLCYVIGALQGFIGHSNQDLKIKVSVSQNYQVYRAYLHAFLLIPLWLFCIYRVHLFRALLVFI